MNLVDVVQEALNDRDPFLALALTIEANQIDQPLVQAQQMLFELAFTSRAIRRFEGHERLVSSVAFSPDGKMALSASFDKTLTGVTQLS